MLIKCFRWRDWRWKHQIALLIILEVLIILSAVIAIEIINDQHLMPQLQEIQKEVALHQISKQLNLLSRQYAQLAQITIQRSTFRTITLKSLYEQQSQLLEIQDPYDCLLGERDQYSWIASYCYNFYGTQENSAKVHDLKQFTSLATQTLAMQDREIDVLFLSLDPSRYYFRHSGAYLVGYDPLQRPWYLQFENQTQKNSISKPYVTFGPNDYVFSKSIFISDIGIITSEFHFHDIDFYTLNSITEVSLIDNSGLVYFSSNQTYIGTNILDSYSKENLQKIIRSKSHKQELRCSLLENMFCLNKENGQMEIIVTNDIGLKDIFLILQYSPIDYLNEINWQLSLICSRLYIIFIRYTTIYLLVRTVAVVIYLLMFNNFMLIPLDDIIAHSQHKISKQFKRTKPKFQSGRDALTQFREAYDKFVNQFTYRQRTKLLELELSFEYFSQTYDTKYQKLLSYLLKNTRQVHNRIK